MSLPSTGLLQFSITGTLQDITSNLPKLVTALQAQGVDPAPLKNAQTGISFGETSITQATFSSIQAAIAVFRQQVAGTSIQVAAQYTLQV